MATKQSDHPITSERVEPVATDTTTDFSKIIPHGGGVAAAFEEMAFQLFGMAYTNLADAVRREGSGGDGGLEGTCRAKMIVCRWRCRQSTTRKSWEELSGSTLIVLSAPS